MAGRKKSEGLDLVIAKNEMKAEQAADLDLMNDEFMGMLRMTLAQVKTELATTVPDGRFADRQVVEKLKALGVMLDSAGSLKIKLAKAAALLGKTLTPEQRLAETLRYIRALPVAKRAEIIRSLAYDHEDQKKKAGIFNEGQKPATAVSRILDAVGGPSE